MKLVIMHVHAYILEFFEILTMKIFNLHPDSKLLWRSKCWLLPFPQQNQHHIHKCSGQKFWKRFINKWGMQWKSSTVTIWCQLPNLVSQEFLLHTDFFHACNEFHNSLFLIWNLGLVNYPMSELKRLICHSFTLIIMLLCIIANLLWH